MKTVYLAGSITGLNYEGATDWREYAIKYLADHDIRGLSPLRCKEYLAGETSVADRYDDYVMSTAKGITTRDRWDVHRCDLVIANLVGAAKVSIGTVMEIAWADGAKKPIILCMETGNIHNHAMIEHVSGFIVPTLTDGLEIATALLV